MDSSDNTIVTMYIDLGYQLYDYVSYAEKLLKLKHNMVIYVEDKNVDFVKSIREKHNLIDKTVIKITSLYEIQQIFDIEKIRKNLEKNPYQYNEGLQESMKNKNSIDYTILVNSKLYFIKKAIEENLFQTKYYTWCDFALDHVNPINEDTQFYPFTDLIRLCHLPFGLKGNCFDEQFLTKQDNHVSGCLFSGSKENMISLIDLFYSLLHEYIKQGYFPREETVLYILTNTHPELFDLYFGVYGHQVANYYQPVNNIDSVLEWVKNYRKNNQFEKSYILAKYLYQNRNHINSKQFFDLLDELIIISFYIDKEDCLEYGNILVDKINQDLTFWHYYQQFRQHIDKNLSFLSLNIELNPKRFNFIEIGTCDFETLIEKADQQTVGISIEPNKEYLDKLPEKKYVHKENIAISDHCGEIKIFHVPLEKIKEHNLPDWLKGCSSVNKAHPTVERILTERGLSNDMVEQTNVEVRNFEYLINKYEIEAINFLKIDTEGHDCVILQNLIDTCLQNPQLFPFIVQFEGNQLTPKPEIDRIVENLKNCGYELVKRDHDVLVKRTFFS